VALDCAGLARYAEHGLVITDDNQLLAYGPGRKNHFDQGGMSTSRRLSLLLIRNLARLGPGPIVPPKSP
jgi:hypothetical protein